MKQTEAFIMIFIICILTATSVIGFTLLGQAYQENEIFKQILLTDTNSRDASSISEKANAFYDEASLYYEEGDYDGVESNCKLARGWFSDSSQKFLELQSELKEIDSDNELILNMIERLGLLSETQLNLFEACEHFESASRYFSNENFDAGNEEIEMMNSKIGDHDNNVRKYNELQSEFSIKLGGYLK